MKTFLSRIEPDTLSDTLRKKHKSNISKAEKQALNKGREIMNNADNEFVLKIQEMVADLYLLIRKRMKKRQLDRLERVTLKELILIQLHQILKSETIFKKWVRKGELSNEWASFIVNPNAGPGKKSTLYEMHKSNVTVRFLTTGYNTVI